MMRPVSRFSGDRAQTLMRRAHPRPLPPSRLIRLRSILEHDLRDGTTGDARVRDGSCKAEQNCLSDNPAHGDLLCDLTFRPHRQSCPVLHRHPEI
jgi:hypothetical protein